MAAPPAPQVGSSPSGAKYNIKPGFNYMVVSINLKKEQKFGMMVKNIKDMVLVSTVAAASMSHGVVKELDQLMEVNNKLVMDRDQCKDLIIAVTPAGKQKGILNQPGQQPMANVRITESMTPQLIATDQSCRLGELKKVPAKQPPPPPRPPPPPPQEQGPPPQGPPAGQQQQAPPGPSPPQQAPAPEQPQQQQTAPSQPTQEQDKPEQSAQPKEQQETAAEVPQQEKQEPKSPLQQQQKPSQPVGEQKSSEGDAPSTDGLDKAKKKTPVSKQKKTKTGGKEKSEDGGNSVE